MPKRRNFVQKNMNKFHRPQTHRDHTKYDRYEDYLQDQLNDYLDGECDDLDEKTMAEKKAEFKAKLAGDAGEEYDPDGHKNYEDWLDTQFYDYYNSYDDDY